MKRTLGKEHPVTAIRYSNLASVLHLLGDSEEAKGLLQKAVLSDEKNFGEEHPSTAIKYSNLASLLHDIGDYEGALQLSAKELDILKRALPEEHPDIERVKMIYELINSYIQI